MTTTAVINDTSLTLDDLILRVAESCGLADYSGDVAAVPASTHDYDLCRRAVNDGIEMIYRANPRWRFLNQPVSFTMATDGTHPWAVEDDGSRYKLPWYVNGQPTETSVTLRGSGSTTYVVPIVAMKTVREARSVNITQGPCRICAIDRLPGTLGGRSQWEMVFYPRPDYAYTVSAMFRCFAPKLVHGSERHVMGAEHDQTVVQAGIYAKKLTDSKDPVEREHYKAAFDTALAESVRLDAEMVPRNLGEVTDPSVSVRPRYWHDIGNRIGMTIVNGVP